TKEKQCVPHKTSVNLHVNAHFQLPRVQVCIITVNFRVAASTFSPYQGFSGTRVGIGSSVPYQSATCTAGGAEPNEFNSNGNPLRMGLKFFEHWAESPRQRLPSHATARDAITAGEYEADRFAIDPVFFREDACRECVDGIVVFHGDGGLNDDRAGIEVFIDEVDGAAGDAHAVIERLALGVEAGEGR